MSVILVVEQDEAYARRIASVLQTAGHSVDILANAESAYQRGGAPLLVLASGTAPESSQLLSRFSKAKQGPGSVAILPVSIAGQATPTEYHADRILPKPFSDEELLRIVVELLPHTQPDFGSLPGGQLTSEDIFGDVLAEVEAEAQVSESRRRRSRMDHSDIDRKLEETLSGFFPDKLNEAPLERPKPPQAKAKRRREVPSADEIEDLLEKTLSSLELPSKSRRQKGAESAPVIQLPQPAAPPNFQSKGPIPGVTSTPVAPPTTNAPSKPESVEIGTDQERPVESFEDAAQQGTEPSDAKKAPAETPPLFTETNQAPTWSRSSTFAPSSASNAPGKVTHFSLDDDSPVSSLPEPSHPTSFAPDESIPSTTNAFNSSAIRQTDSSFPPADEPAPDGPSWLNPPTPEPPPFDSPSSFASSSFEAAAAKTPSAQQATFSLGEAPPLASPEYPTTFASFDESSEEPSLEPPSFGAQDEEPPSPPTFEPKISPDTLSFAPPSFLQEEQPSKFDDSSSSGSARDVPALTTEPSSSFDNPVGAAASSSVSPSPSGLDSFVPLEESSEAQAPEPSPPPFSDPDPFAASRHGVQPTDFVSAFSMPEKEEPADVVEDSTDHLKQALDGVLQIRGDGEAPTTPDQEGTPFGDYRLLERIAVGGMAEVWKARRRGVEGFQKTVAIKKILSHLTGSSDFVTMFIDEAKLAAQLNHANIIQIYDLGKADDDFFIAMELVDGKDLRSILNQAADQGRPLPAGLALTIVAALARALDYAHRKRDFENRAMGLVHRDVSPQNVLISYEGEIKLCDFGIVKAVAKASTTQMGALKGKLQYMSPEQAWGKEVDARSDIFSLGSVLFEVLTGQRLFTGDSEIGVLDAVRDCRVRAPRKLNPDLPAEVDRITLKALAKTPEERYQTAGDLERDILTLLESLKPSPGQGELAAYLESLFQSAPAPSPSVDPSPTQSIAPAAGPEAPLKPEPLRSPGTASTTSAPAKEQPSKGKAKIFLILGIILAALVTIAFILYETLGPGFGSRNDAAPTTIPAPAPAVAPQGEDGQAGVDQTGDGSDPQNEAEASDAKTEDEQSDEADTGNSLKGLVDEALASERERLEADFEAERKRLQDELNKVQKSSKQNTPAGGSTPNN